MFETEDITDELVVNVEAQLVDPGLSYLFVTVIAEVDAPNKPLVVSDRAIGQIDNGVEHLETVVSGDRTYYVIREEANSDTFMINVAAVNECGICVSYGYQELFNEECDLKITEPGTYSMDLSDAFEEHLHIMIHSGSDSIQTVQFTAYYLRLLQNSTAQEQLFTAYVPQYFTYKSSGAAATIFSATKKMDSYNPNSIPEEIFARKLTMFIARGRVPTQTDFDYNEYYVGPQAVYVPVEEEESTETVFVLMITAVENCTLQLAATEKVKQYAVDYGKEQQVTLKAGESADFVLDSAYAPSGAIIEVCSGHPTFNFSYYNIPSLNEEFSQPLVYEQLNYGQLKVVLNSTNDRQNFFATASADGDATFIVHHSYIDTRPAVPDKKIRITESTDDGYLTVTVDPVSSTNPVKYVVYVQTNSNSYNSTACGVRNGGMAISERTSQGDGEKLVNIRTVVPLNGSDDYVLNVIASDLTNSKSSAAYQAIKVHRGMDPFDNDYDDNSSSDDLTWIIWVVLAVVIVAVGVALVLFFYHKKTYQAMKYENLSKKNLGSGAG